ncbi:MAG TPA: hypothetical protein VFU15_05685 [Bacteroidia bacterium]|nr:hypothetical protein [Bacteroidia bacterium]
MVRTRYIVFVLVVVLVILVNLVRHFRGDDSSPRTKEYVALSAEKMSRGDSAFVLSFYDQLQRIYDTLNTTDLCGRGELVFSGKKDLPADFVPKLITFRLLDFIFDSAAAVKQTKQERDDAYESAFGYSNTLEDINSTMGNGNFKYDVSHRVFNGGFLNDVKYIRKEKYIMVLLTCDLGLPRFEEGTSHFEPGRFSGGVAIFDIATTKLVGYYNCSAGSDDEISALPRSKSGTDEMLLENLLENIRKSVEDVSQRAYGKPLSGMHGTGNAYSSGSVK